MPLISNNRVSNLINSQVPFFVRNDHLKFVTFLEKYYEYLEQNEKTINEAHLLGTFRDIDITENQFATRLYDTFMKYLPKRVLADRDLMLKNIKDFYRAKGTEKSVRFLFNVLYNVQDMSFYYPKEDILRASDGKWYIQKSLRVESVELDSIANTNLSGLQKYINTEIRGNTSNATAIVESVEKYFLQGTEVSELVLSSIKKEFEEGEEIFTKFDEDNVTRTISATVFGGIVNSIKPVYPGLNYKIGDPVIVNSLDSGNGACAIVSKVSSGSIESISVLYSGAGFQSNNLVLITGGGGSDATARVSFVVDDNFFHPKSYNIVSSTINLEANTLIGNSIYSNLNPAVADPANNWVQNSMSYWTYSNTGPATIIQVIDGGIEFSEEPEVSIVANSAIYSLGILGRMDIISGGSDYEVDDRIEFINVPGGFGVGAYANVRAIGVDGDITEVEFIPLPSSNGQYHIIGGTGYDMDFLPTTNVISATGTGANIAVTSILGAGATFRTQTSNVGSIEAISIISGGSGYRTAPIIDLSQSGDGTATATANIIGGIADQPGRFLDDDGQVSAFNFLQDRDFYQLFSYVINSPKSVNTYRKPLNDLTHPAGTKMFGRRIYGNNGNTTNTFSTTSANSSVISYIYESIPYVKTGNTINLQFESHSFQNAHSFQNGDILALDFKPNDYRPYAVSLDNAWFYKSSRLTGIDRTKTGTISFWIQTDADWSSNVNSRILHFSDTEATFDVMLTTSGTIRILGKNNYYETLLSETHNVDVADGNWHHVVASWKTDDANSSFFSVDGIVRPIDNVLVDGKINYSQRDISIAAGDEGRNKLRAHMADLLFWHDQNLNLNTAANLALFYANSTSLPVDPDTANGVIDVLGDPIIRLTATPEFWQVNQGTGGGFIKVGEILESALNPSANDAVFTGFFTIANTTTNNLLLTQKSSLANVFITQAGLDYPNGYRPQVMRFDGSSLYLTVDEDNSGMTNAKTGTISAWFRAANTYGTGQSIVNSEGQAFRLFINDQGFLNLRAENGSGTAIMNKTISGEGNTVNDNTWHHVVASWDLTGTDNHIVLDGELIDITTITNDTIYYSRDWSVGALANGATKFKGHIADVIFWDDKHIDLANPENVLMFYANSLPVNPDATGGAIDTLGTPVIRLTHDYDTWEENQGSGGDFTVVGNKREPISNPNPANTSNGYLYVVGDGNDANVRYTVNTRGAIVNVEILGVGVNFTQAPTLTAIGTNTFPAVFSAPITCANNSSGNVDIRATVVRYVP